MRILGVIVGLIAAAYVGYQLAYPTYTYRYRMTVEVAVDGQVRSGSSVIQIEMVKQPPIITSEPPVLPKVRGEAVFVDLGRGRNLIALLASGPNATDVDYPSYVVTGHFGLSISDADLRRYPRLQGTWELARHQLPTLVTFTDLGDPKTARVVEPGEFAHVFGPDVRFKGAYVEMVPAGTWPFNMLGWPPSLSGVPITCGIENKVTGLKNSQHWNEELRGGSYDPARIHVGSGAFTRRGW